MKHIKAYEELNYDTYRSAADKLGKYGHKKRPDKLKKHAEVIKRKNIINALSPFGKYKIDIDGEVGEYYISLSIDEDRMYDIFDNWKKGLDDSAWLVLDFGVYGTDDSEVWKKIQNIYGENYVAWIGDLQINLSKNYKEVTDTELYNWGIKKPIDVDDLKGELLPSSSIHIDGSEFNWSFADRREAMKFKKSLFKLFNGDINYGPTVNGKVFYNFKEKFTDMLFDEFGVSFEEIERFIDSLKKIRLNYLYSD